MPITLFSAGKPVIMLDPGHGGKDEGAKIRSLIEKQMTLRTSYLAKKHLEALGYRVILTRARDLYLPLGTRVTRANRRPSSLFVSIHFNSAAAIEAKGIEVYYFGKSVQKRRVASQKMGKAILDAMVKETGARSRGVRRGNFQVIRETTMPAVLIEAGFITNAEERKLLSTQTYLDKLAKGIASGVHKYIQSK